MKVLVGFISSPEGEAALGAAIAAPMRPGSWCAGTLRVRIC